MQPEINEKELIQILQDLVRIPSINPPGYEYLVTNYLTRLFDKEGVNYWTVDVGENRKSIVAIIEGKNRGDGIIFTGHQDVVPISEDEKERWSVNPFCADIIDGKVYGRGSSDMKSGVSAFTMAFLALKRANYKPNKDIILAITCDEEHYMKGSSSLLNDEVIRSAKYCVVCEPTSMELCYASKGRTWAEIIVHGKTAHGSQKGLGINAIEDCSDLISKIKEHRFTDKTNELTGETFWQPYAISAGVEPAIVPDRCSMFVDARLTLNHYPDEVWSDLYKIIEEIKKTNPKFSACVDVVEKRSPWVTDKNSKIVSLAVEGLKLYGIEAKFNIFMGSTDGTKFNSIGIKPIIMGPGDLSCVHKENENVSIEETILASKIYLEMMKNYE